MRIWTFASPLLHLALLSALSACSSVPVPGDAEGEPGVGAYFAEEAVAEADPSGDDPFETATGPGDDGAALTDLATPAPSVTLFLNRHGGAFRRGPSSSSTNRSSLVPGESAELKPYGGSDDGWREVVDCIGEQFAPFNVAITEEEPREGEYIEVVVGDRPTSLGLPSKVVGIAPMDTRGCRVIKKAVVFVFAEQVGERRSRRVCEVAAQEVGHALGLDHEFLCEDPMSYLKGCRAPKVFQNVDARCGEHSSRDCMCGGETQNSMQVLAKKLGLKDGSMLPPPQVDEAPPEIAFVETDARSSTGGEEVVVAAQVDDDVSVSQVELVWEEDGKEVAAPCSKASPGATCRRDGDRFSWRLRNGDVSRSLRLRAEDAAGNVTVRETAAPRRDSLAGAEPVRRPSKSGRSRTGSSA